MIWQYFRTLSYFHSTVSVSGSLAFLLISVFTNICPSPVSAFPSSSSFPPLPGTIGLSFDNPCRDCFGNTRWGSGNEFSDMHKRELYTPNDDWRRHTIDTLDTLHFVGGEKGKPVVFLYELVLRRRTSWAKKVLLQNFSLAVTTSDHLSASVSLFCC
jgi:hypothetical protein